MIKITLIEQKRAKCRKNAKTSLIFYSFPLATSLRIFPNIVKASMDNFCRSRRLSFSASAIRSINSHPSLVLFQGTKALCFFPLYQLNFWPSYGHSS